MFMIARTLCQTTPALQRFAAALVLIGALSAAPAHAAIQEYTVVATGIDRSSVDAAAKAMAYAKARAVYLAARKLGVDNAASVVSKIPPDALQQIIRGATVTQTIRKGDVTQSEVSVSIVTEALQRALKVPDTMPTINTGMGSHARGVLLLSVYVTPNRSYMWEPDNILRAPLGDEVQRQSHGGVMLSGADFDDLRLIDYNNAMKVTADELKPMFERYGAREIIIAFMTPGTEGTTEPATILLRRLSPENTRSEVMQIKPTEALEPLESRVLHSAAAIAAAATQIASSTTEEDQNKLAKATKIKIHFEYVTPQRLARMQDAVRKAPHVLLLELPSIALNDVEGVIYLDGDPNELRALLAKQGILILDADGGWKASVR